jgi:hypothetical protein
MNISITKNITLRTNSGLRSRQRLLCHSFFQSSQRIDPFSKTINLDVRTVLPTAAVMQPTMRTNFIDCTYAMRVAVVSDSLFTPDVFFEIPFLYVSTLSFHRPPV